MASSPTPRPRCKHPRAELRTFHRATLRGPFGWIHAHCPDCERGWKGGYLPWYSYRGKRHQPPQWVINMIPAMTPEEMQSDGE